MDPPYITHNTPTSHSQTKQEKQQRNNTGGDQVLTMDKPGEEKKPVIEDEQTLQLPLLATELSQAAAPPPGKTPAQKVVRKAFKGTALLSNLLPTGSVLTFQVLSPVMTHEGKCKSFVSKTTTLVLLSLCAFSCFVLTFTDSFRDTRGKVRYGLATFRGIWIIDSSDGSLPAEEAPKFRIRFLDFFHAFLSVLVFSSVVMFDKNVTDCFCPSPSEEMQEILASLPVAVGVVSSALFLLFPTRRHGIGFPLSRR